MVSYKRYFSYRHQEPELWINMFVVPDQDVFGWAYYTACLSMSMYLKGGPCFILPSEGVLSGIFNWRFMLLMLVVPLQVNMKFLHINGVPTLFLSYSAGMCIFSLLLAVFSLYQALGCWRTLLKVISSHPALLLLPVFTCFTFGGHDTTENSLVLSWKWTVVNMMVSFFGITMKMLFYIDVAETKSLCSWISSGEAAHADRYFYYLIGCNCLTLGFTILLSFTRLQYGVLLASQIESPYVIQVSRDLERGKSPLILKTSGSL